MEQRDFLLSRMSPEQIESWKRDNEDFQRELRLIDAKSDDLLTPRERTIKFGGYKETGLPLPGEEQFNLLDEYGAPTRRCQLVNPTLAEHLRTTDQIIYWVPKEQSAEFEADTGFKRLPDLPSDYDPISNPETYTYELPALRPGERPQRVLADLATREPADADEAAELHAARNIAALAAEPIPGRPRSGLARRVLIHTGNDLACGRIGATVEMLNPVAVEADAATVARAAPNHVRSGVVSPEAVYGDTPSLDPDRDNSRNAGAHYWASLQRADAGYARVSDDRASAAAAGLVDVDDENGPGVAFVDPASIVFDPSVLPLAAPPAAVRRVGARDDDDDTYPTRTGPGAPDDVAAAARRAARDAADLGEVKRRRDALMRDSFRASMAELMNEGKGNAACSGSGRDKTSEDSSTRQPRAHADGGGGSADYSSVDPAAAKTALPNLLHEDTCVLASPAFKHVATEWLRCALIPWRFRSVRLYVAPFEAFSPLSSHVLDAVVATVKPNVRQVPRM